MATHAVKKATNTLIFPTSDRVTDRAAITGAIATPNVLGRVAINHALIECGAIVEFCTTRAPL